MGGDDQQGHGMTMEYVVVIVMCVPSFLCDGKRLITCWCFVLGNLHIFLKLRTYPATYAAQ